MTDELNARQKRLSDTERPEVLIITADIGLGRFLSEGLLQDGFWPSIVGGGLQALEVFRLRQFDVVIIDATVGDLPAGLLARRLRSDQPHNNERPTRTTAPLLLIAADKAEVDQIADADRGIFSTVLLAPLEIDEIANSIDAALLQDYGATGAIESSQSP